jgi:hypothetical protein
MLFGETARPLGDRRKYFEIYHKIKTSVLSSVVEFQIWWVLKSKILAKNQHKYSKDFFLNPSMYAGSSKRAKIVLSMPIFDVKNRQNAFHSVFFISFQNKNINLGDHFLSKIFFSSLKF